MDTQKHLNATTGWFKPALSFAVGAAIAASAQKSCSERDTARQVDDLLATIASQHDEIVRTTVRRRTLQQALDDAGAENTRLAALVVELRQKSREVREVVRFETRIEPAAPPVVVRVGDDLPDEHLFALESGMTVARFLRRDDSTVFQTYAQTWRANAVIGEASSTLLLEGKTSHGPTWYEIEVDNFAVTRVGKPDRVLSPRLGMGITVGGPRPEVTASLLFSWLYPHPDVSVAGVRVSGNNTVIRGGIDVVGYNIGRPLPLIDDLWVHAGVSLGSSGWPDTPYAVDVTVATRF